MDSIAIRNIFAAVFEKSLLDPLLSVLDPKSVRFWGTEGTVKYLKAKGFSAKSVVGGFDFDGRVKSLDRRIFARILADRTNKKHLEELRNVIARSEATKQSQDRHVESDSTRDDKERDPFDVVIVDLYPPDPNNFPESMDIGGQALIRASVKNYKNVAVAFDKKSITDLSAEIDKNNGSVTLSFRKKQATKALKFIAERCKLEANHEL